MVMRWKRCDESNLHQTFPEPALVPINHIHKKIDPGCWSSHIAYTQWLSLHALCRGLDYICCPSRLLAGCQMTVNMNESVMLNITRLCPCSSFLLSSLSRLAASFTSITNPHSTAYGSVSTTVHIVIKHTNMLTDQTTTQLLFIIYS